MGNLALFHDPTTGSTLALDKADVTPELVRQHLDESRQTFGIKSASVSGEDVVTHIQNTTREKISREEAYQRAGIDSGGEYRLTDIPTASLEAGDDYDSKLAKKYADQKGPLPAIVLDGDGRIRDGNHRVAAAQLRGEPTIKAYVPIDTFKPAVPEVAEDAVTDAKKSGGGFVADLRTGKATDTGFLVEMMPEKRVQLDHDATPKDIQKFYNDNRQLFRQHPELRIGGYKNELNISAHTEDQASAEKLAKKLDQRSVWDVKNGEEIPTGGKGQQREFKDYPFEQRIKDLRNE